MTADLPKPIHSSSRWFFVAIGLFLALIGSIFVWLMARSFLRAYEMRQWPEISCVILSSEVEEKQHDRSSPLEFRQKISYGYRWQNQAYTGERITLRGNPWTSKRNAIEERMQEFPSGKTTTCRVNPNNPSFAVLKPDSLAPGYSIWFPALFVIGGLGIAIRSGKSSPSISPK